MLTKRIIPCLDIKDGRTVKGINFIDLIDAGDPVEQAVAYTEEGADELVFLDITATNEKRKTLSALVKEIARNINIPFTVGGGINAVQDVAILLESGADKVSINTSAFKSPAFITEVAKNWGSQCVVVAIDSRYNGSFNEVYLNGGRTPTGMQTEKWAEQAYENGAGEILLTSMDHDGTKKGFACALTKVISEKLPIPVIASGGAGKIEHFTEVFITGKADAALAASIFHFNEIAIPNLKSHLKQNGIEIRTEISIMK